MINKIRSHLASSRGFTLIELLVVIAIIAILVVIVIVAINPVERLNEARDRAAQSNVRSTGTLMATCITKEIELGSSFASIYTTAAGGCANSSKLGSYGTVPTVGTSTGQVTFGADTTGSTNADLQICVWSLGRAGTFYRWQSSTGAIDSGASANSCPAI